ncbi:non-ribosomal peptide synthetase [Williamsia sp.]|uniref:non-ribosomal peptide synthetase n=1 Tax=Williamsia sp. TaxID=1872085 RepID=UPI001A2F4B8C|nr:non-ribosomal peptide synthetase [Williamsia sp.]MBJ7287738.1 amino acid adenylation domain-containing protein [Williamsia sp.]
MGAPSNGGRATDGERVAGLTTGPIPLTAAQRGMWFAERLHADYSVTVAHYLDIRDEGRPLDHDLFCAAVLEAARSLESAFTRIVVVDDVPMQWVDPSVDFRVVPLDMRSEPDPVAAARAWMDADHRRPMDLETDRVAISALIRVADDRCFWYLRGHHIAFDGFSALTSLHEAVHRYNAMLAGAEHVPPARASLAEISADDVKYAQSTRRQTDREHWVARVADLPEGPTLSRRATNAPLSPANVMASTRISRARQDLLDATAAAGNTSAAALLTAAFAAYLSRMTGVDDVVLSLPVTGRASARVKRGSGMVANMLPVRIDGVVGATGRELIAQVQLELTGALRHQRFRYEDIRLAAGMADATAASFGPIVNLVFFDRRIEIDGARADYHILSSGTLDDLRINLYQSSPGECLVVDLHGNPNLYDQDELDTHLERFLLLVDRLLGSPDTPIADLSVLLDGERDALLAQGRGARRADTPGEHLLAGFEAQVAATPDAVAIEAPDVTLSYRGFADLRTDLAQRLRHDGVVPGDRVVVALDRGVAQVAAVYAVLTLGAVYVPVDPTDPRERRDAIEAGVGARLRIDAAYLTSIGVDPTRPAPASTGSAELVVAPGAAAYVIFTSGSTGTPKGVEVGHRAVLNRLDWMQDDHRIDGTDAVLHKTPTTFDVSVWELFWPLRTGARMVIARPGGHRDPDHLHDLMAARGVTVAHFVPSMLDVYLDVVSADGRATSLPASVRTVFTSGEALGAATAARLLGSSTAELVNLYGPTEAAVDVTAHRVAAGVDPVPIGRPVAETEVYVLDASLRPVPAGVAGELYLAGRQLANGYVGAPGITADRFVANPFDGTGARMYRTGDLVRWNDIGEIDYLGRTDLQVKIRGRRVELGEIESVLASLPGVEAAAVLARSDLGPAVTLVAYVRGDADVLDVDMIADRCRRRLPSHMVPTAVVVLDDFPVTSSGKLNRRALPAPVLRSDTPHREAESAVEIALADLIRGLLRVERVGMRDNIFALGADSLIAARLVSVARTEHRLAVDLADVFDSPSIGELAARTQPVADVDAAAPSLPRPASIPLSHAQTRLWFINRMDPSAPTYNMSGAVRLGPDVDVAAFAAAVRDVVERHAILRTVFPSVDGEPVQQVLEMDAVAPGLDAQILDGRVVDAQGLDERVASTVNAESAVAALIGTGFDLEHEIGFRAHLLPSTGPGATSEPIAVLVVHHIAADGQSLRPLIGDLRHAYDRRRAGGVPEFSPLPIDFAEVALRQQARLGGLADPTPVLIDGLEFWRRELDGAPGLLTLPTDRPRPQVADGRGAHVDTALDADLSAGIRSLATHLAVTPFAVLHTGLAVVLSRLAGTDDVSIGSAVAGRDDPATADMVGMFVNTVVLRSRIRPAQSVADLVTSSHRGIAGAMAHAEVPFERVVDALAPQRSSGYAPLFQVALTMQSDPLAGVADRSDIDAGPDARVPAAKYDLTVTITEPAEGTSTRGYAIEINYATALFDESTIRTLGDHLRRVLGAIVAAPSAPVGRIGLLDGRDPVVATTSVPSNPQRTLSELLAAGADAADPHAPAVSGAVSITWAVFESRTNELARELISRGVGPGQVVAISIGRSHHSVMAVVAVAKTGAAFVTIDPRQPDARRAALIADSTATLGLTISDLGTPPSDGRAMTWLAIDEVSFELGLAGHSGSRIHPSELRRPVHTSDLAYLLFTSGSTGRPKAAAVTHAGLADLVATQASVLSCDRTCRVLHVASPSFDVSLFEMIMGLCAGAELVISPPDVFAGPELAALIAGRGVTHAVMTPSALATIAPSEVPTLRIVASAGEQCPPELVTRWAGAGRDLHNFYGPTEATITATTTSAMRVGEPVTIGRAIDGMTTLVLDDWLRPVPAGVAGELYLAGPALGRGYHDRPGLTATRFVANPFDAGATRMYRSGDRVTRTPAGDLIYHGRTDFQIKIRGVRVEPGEIDDVLTSIDGVEAALTVATTAPGGEEVLVSYVTPAPGEVLVPQHVVDAAARALPAYLVPRTVAVLDEFPLTTVGKIDRSALPPVTLTVSPDSVAPRSQLESVVAGVFAQVLGVDTVGVYDNFFAAGGNSLSATKVVARLETLLDRRISVRTLLENPTVATLVGAVTTADVRGPVAPPLTVRPRSEVVPVSGVQRSMWLVNRADPDSASYNVSLALRLTGAVDVPALRAAITDLVRRRETLRTTYPLLGGEPVQMIRPAAAVADDFVVPLVDLTARSATSTDEIPAAIAAVTDRGFDLTTGIPVRAAVVRVGPDDHLLVFVVHHISADGASLMPLARDLVDGYTAHLAGRTITRAPLPLNYADWVVWQRERLAAVDADGATHADRQLAYWTRRLAGAPDRIGLPTDRPRPTTPGSGGDVLDFEIPAPVVDALKSIAREHNSTLFMVVHAAFAVLMSRLSGHDDVVVGTPYAGRDDETLDDMVGMFVNTLALRTRVRSGEGFDDLLHRVRGEDLADMAHADVAFDEIVSRVVASPTGSHNPVFQVMFAFQNIVFPTVELDGLRITPEPLTSVAAKVDLEFMLFPVDPSGADRGGAMAGRVIFATDLYDAPTVDRIVARYGQVLRAVASDPTRIVGDIDIALDHPTDAAVLLGAIEESAAGTGSDPADLAHVVAEATAIDPDATAVEYGGVAVSFAEIDSMATALMMTLPDGDAYGALTMALTAVVPEIADDGAEVLDAALDQLQVNACRIVGAATAPETADRA